MVPRGYEQKPKFITAQLRSSSGHRLGEVRLAKLHEPVMAIKGTERRMHPPRWLVELDSRKRVKLTVPNERTSSYIRALRTTHTIYPEWFHSDVRTGEVALSPHEAIYLAEQDPREIELEELEFKKTEKNEMIKLQGLSLELVYNKAVLVVPKEIRITTPSGLLLNIPAQRAAPLRPGLSTTTMHNVELSLAGYATDPDPKYHSFMTRFKVVKIEPNLAAFGVSSLGLAGRGSRTLKDKRYALSGLPKFTFDNASQTVKPGPLPPLKIYLKGDIWKAVGHYKGIVPVRRS
jgi:hypothetical protein